MLQNFSFARIVQQFGVSQNHSSHPNYVHPSLADRRLRHMRQIILQIAVRSSKHNQIRKSLLQFARHIHLPRHADQRVFRRLISVRRRIQRRPLNMRIVIRASRREVHQPNLQVFQQCEKLNRFRQIWLRGIFRVHTKAPSIRN